MADYMGKLSQPAIKQTIIDYFIIVLILKLKMKVKIIRRRENVKQGNIQKYG